MGVTLSDVEALEKVVESENPDLLSRDMEKATQATAALKSLIKMDSSDAGELSQILSMHRLETPDIGSSVGSAIKSPTTTRAPQGSQQIEETHRQQNGTTPAWSATVEDDDEVLAIPSKMAGPSIASSTHSEKPQSTSKYPQQHSQRDKADNKGSKVGKIWSDRQYSSEVTPRPCRLQSRDTDWAHNT
ncbi:MAG: hypothetical protein M1823_002253 [Watsoniomyces obsoletus]|nr:MAG: hypothetical protein M1823_002253 [Watsoniomyces obsoletus]